jgi:hypothetical protein
MGLSLQLGRCGLVPRFGEHSHRYLPDHRRRHELQNPVLVINGEPRLITPRGIWRGPQPSACPGNYDKFQLFQFGLLRGYESAHNIGQHVPPHPSSRATFSATPSGTLRVARRFLFMSKRAHQAPMVTQPTRLSDVHPVAERFDEEAGGSTNKSARLMSFVSGKVL